MDKYEPLWRFIADSGDFPSELGFDEIERVLGFPIDHSFLSYKKDALRYGFAVGKISLKNRTVLFVRA